MRVPLVIVHPTNYIFSLCLTNKKTMFAIYTDEHGIQYQRKAKFCLNDEHGETYCSSANQLVRLFNNRYPDVHLTQQKLYGYFDEQKMSRLRKKGLPPGVSVSRV